MLSKQIVVDCPLESDTQGCVVADLPKQKDFRVDMVSKVLPISDSLSVNSLLLIFCPVTFFCLSFL